MAETNEAGEVTAFYTLGEDLISMERNVETWYYIYDGHGSVRHLTDSNGTVTDSYSYDAYGNLLEKEGTTENDFLYAGEQYNAGTGLYYLRARYMDPSTGIFISMDSYQGSIYDPVSLHKYLYANANPVMYTDPSGYFSLSEISISTKARGILSATYGLMLKSIRTSIIAGAVLGGIDSLLGGNDFQQILKDTFTGALMGLYWGSAITLGVTFAKAYPVLLVVLKITPVAFALTGYFGIKESASEGNILQTMFRSCLTAFSIFGMHQMIKNIEARIQKSSVVTRRNLTRKLDGLTADERAMVEDLLASGKM